jgi:hypothetical protein
MLLAESAEPDHTDTYARGHSQQRAANTAATTHRPSSANRDRAAGLPSRREGGTRGFSKQLFIYAVSVL